MDDQEILQFIYNRLVNKYKENPDYDYMKRLEHIVKNFPHGRNDQQ